MCSVQNLEILLGIPSLSKKQHSRMGLFLSLASEYQSSKLMWGIRILNYDPYISATSGAIHVRHSLLSAMLSLLNLSAPYSQLCSCMMDPSQLPQVRGSERAWETVQG